jgi:peptide/nickel transport system ATP-binding protein
MLSIRELSIDYQLAAHKKLSVLEKVSLDFPDGCVTAIIGESGSGKSTLMGALLRLLAPNAKIRQGEIYWGNENLLNLAPEALRSFRWHQASVVFQAAQGAWNPTLTLGQQMLDVCKDHNYPNGQARLEKLLTQVRLDPTRIAACYPHQLSGGMRQRALIAMALMLEPELLILDEPTTALDLITQSYVFDILAEIQRESKLTMILVTHDLAAVARLADHVAVLYAGTVVEVASVEDIFMRPQHPYTQILLNSAPPASSDQKPVSAGAEFQPPDLQARPFGCIFASRCPESQPQCLSETPQLGIEMVACHYRRRGEMSESGGLGATFVSSEVQPLDPEVTGPNFAGGPGLPFADGALPPPHHPQQPPTGSLTGTNLVPALEGLDEVGRSPQPAPEAQKNQPVGAEQPQPISPTASGVKGPGALPLVVELRGVSVELGKVLALREVDFSLAAGEIVTVVGESGCGKTTLGRAVLGLLPPKAGHVRFQGQDINAPGFVMTDALRLSVQMVHQDSYASLNPVLTVRQQLAAPLIHHKLVAKGLINDTVDQILSSVGLTPVAFFGAKVPFQLSGGQRQRVSLARAALLKPKVIVADEPVSGVDATVRLAILDLMKRLNQQGIAFLYITHDLATARYLGQGGRMLVMYLGKIIETGSGDELMDKPLHPYLQALLAALPQLDRTQNRALPLRSLDMPDPTKPPSGCSFHPRCPYAQDRCSQEEPKLREVLGHSVACHFAEALRVSASST